MELNYFDLVASIIILLLGLKGVVNGFFKEVFGLVGIIGGIFVASRVGERVGQLLSDLIFKFDNSAAISFTGFLTTLALFWFLMIGVGFIFKKLSSLSGLGPIDKILGFIFGASKFFLIAAVIAYASYSIHAIKATIDSNMKSSMLFPILVETGSFIMKLDPTEISNDMNATLQNKVTESVNTATQNIVNETKKEIKEVMPQVAKDAKMVKDGK
ncbi:MAG: CvpA family protein [Campylobacterales bacterium]|nr:CvpA family protein [Campylobacterales bacterium]